MWIEELENGKYKYVERYEDPLTHKQRKVSITNSKNNKRIEKEMFIKLQEKIDKKTSSFTKDVKFSELSHEWLKVYKKRVRASTYKVNKYRLNTIIEAFGQIKLNRLTAATINRFLLKEFEKGLVYESVNSKKKLIMQILSFGIEYGYISDVTLPQKIKIQRLNVSEDNDWKFLERYEMQEVLSYFEKNNMHEEVRLCKIQAATGLRFSEMVAIDYKEHIDFRDKRIHVDRSYDRSNKIFTLPKNNKKRIININDDTLRLIQEQIQYDQLKMMNLNLDRKNTLLFRTRFDNPYSLRIMDKKLKRINIASGKNLTTHIFRHTFITLMVENGVDAKLIAEHVGHADTKMIEKVYSHFTENMDKKLKQAISNVKIV